MDHTRMPNHPQGEWIWADNLIDCDDGMLLFRKEFTLEHFGLDASLWLSANCAYQLYINDKLVGSGPRPCSKPGFSSVDQHDVYYYLQSGINVVAIQVYYSAEISRDYRRTPGLWCQFETDKRTVMVSDESWSMFANSSFSVPRARSARDEGLLEYFDCEIFPPHWTSNNFLARENWHKPTYSKGIFEYGSRLENYQLRPAQAEKRTYFKAVGAGTISDTPEMSFFSFGQIHTGGRGVYGAAGYLSTASTGDIPVRLFSDEPLRIFCGEELIYDGEGLMGEEVVFPLKSEWTRITVYQNTPSHSMGLYLEFPRGSKAAVHTAANAKSTVGWMIAGPFRMSYETLTGDLDFSRLNSTEFEQRLDNINDISSYLASAKLIGDEEFDGGKKIALKQGEAALFKLDGLRYGFPTISLSATRNDIVDITIGYTLGENGLPARGRRRRCTHTIRCRSRENEVTFFRPRECCYLAVSVRKALDEVKVGSISFSELKRVTNQPNNLHTSEKWINQLWSTGCRALTRSAGFVAVNEPRAKYDTYMFDAYIESVNMICSFGDFSYSSAQLREFINSQLENGDISAISSSGKYLPQGPHLFILPIWATFNYRVAGDYEELLSLKKPMNYLIAYWEKLRNKCGGLLREPDRNFHPKSRISLQRFTPEAIPVYLNSFYCRFLLSAAEFFRALKDEKDAEYCMTVAQEIIGKLRGMNQNSADGFFPLAFGSDNEEYKKIDVFSNFCAVLGGVIPLENFPRFREKFFDGDWENSPHQEEMFQPYFHFLFMEMLHSVQWGDWIFDYFREYWSRRSCPGLDAWKLSLNSSDPAPVRMYDGWTVSPNMVILRNFAGVRLSEQGQHSTVYLNPKLDLITELDASISVVKGKLTFKLWKNNDGTLSILLDSNFPVRVVTEFSDEVLKNTSFEVGETVQLFRKN